MWCGGGSGDVGGCEVVVANDCDVGSAMAMVSLCWYGRGDDWMGPRVFFTNKLDNLWPKNVIVSPNLLSCDREITCNKLIW